jgi:hypothetical protein
MPNTLAPAARRHLCSSRTSSVKEKKTGVLWGMAGACSHFSTVKFERRSFNQKKTLVALSNLSGDSIILLG